MATRDETVCVRTFADALDRLRYLYTLPTCSPAKADGVSPVHAGALRDCAESSWASQPRRSSLHTSTSRCHAPMHVHAGMKMLPANSPTSLLRSVG